MPSTEYGQDLRQALYSGDSRTGKSGVNPTSIAVGPGGFSKDPTVSKPQHAKVPGKKANQDSDVNLTWEQRAVSLLSRLVAAKVFKDLQPKLRNEILKLISDAPDSAR